NAVALHASVTNAARLVGPSIGGAIVAHAGEGVCFLVNGASYAAVVLALLAMRTAPEAPARPATPILQGLRETARYARSTRPIAATLLLVALVPLLGRPFPVLLPGLGVMVHLASSNALIQTLVADDERGRVMGLYTMAFVGLAPVGTLLAGTLAASLGAARMVLLGGLCCLAGSLAFGRRLPRKLA